jgi:hypothetical protein
MKKILGVMILAIHLTGCSSSTVKKINLDEINTIKNKDYLIIAFSGYQRNTDTIFEVEINNYRDVEKLINDHCKQKNKNTYKTSHRNELINYNYGSGIEAVGQRFWCAHNLKEANNLYARYLKDPPDNYLSRSQLQFKKDSIRYIKQGRTDLIDSEIIYHFERSGLSLYKENNFLKKIKKDNVKENKKKTKSNLVRD